MHAGNFALQARDLVEFCPALQTDKFVLLQGGFDKVCAVIRMTKYSFGLNLESLQSSYPTPSFSEKKHTVAKNQSSNVL